MVTVDDAVTVDKKDSNNDFQRSEEENNKVTGVILAC
jgi:hypothetical protein